MNRRQRMGSIIALTLILWLSSTICLSPQAMTNLVVPLQINHQFEQEPMAAWIEFEQNPSPGLGHSRFGKAPGGTLVKIESVIDQLHAYRISVDSNGDRDLTDDSAYVIQPDSTITVSVSRKWKSNKDQVLPYLITYSRRVDKDGKAKETFYWRPRYCAEGKVKVKGCEARFVVLDIDGNGLFDQQDFRRGTTIGLDRNGDGRIWGKEEWLMGSQILEYCDAAFLIEGIEPDGRAVTLAATALRIPKLGERLPSFSLTTIDGKKLNFDELRGKVFLLDFWASWCQPCVEKFPRVKELDEKYGEDLEVIAINVDEKTRLKQAQEVKRKYGLSWRQVASGQGENGPIWKSLGGMEGNRLAIPLYILIAPDGKLTYAGHGGADLFELRGRIEDLLKELKARRK